MRTLLFCNKAIHVAYSHKLLFFYFVIVTGVGWIHVARNCDWWRAWGSIQDVNFRLASVSSSIRPLFSRITRWFRYILLISKREFYSLCTVWEEGVL
jgi:hypothetical protein